MKFILSFSWKVAWFSQLYCSRLMKSRNLGWCWINNDIFFCVSEKRMQIKHLVKNWNSFQVNLVTFETNEKVCIRQQSLPFLYSKQDYALKNRVHRQKREQKAAHPRAMLSFKIAEFANFMIWKQFTDVVKNFSKIIFQIFPSIIHTQAIKVRAQFLKFLDIWVL